ncbi:MAG: hypothetical protein ACM359_17625 [Bacillota bacterium]
MITKTRQLRLSPRTPIWGLRPQAARPIPPPMMSPRIVRPTAVLIDKSESMGHAIELGRQVLRLISPLCQGRLYAYAFDTGAYAIQRNTDDVGRWDAALSRMIPGGFKACGAAIDSMRRQGEYVEQLVLITDQRENANPTFVETYRAYAMEMGVRPEVCIIKPLDSSGWLEHRCRETGVPFEVLAIDGDEKELTSLIPLLA